MRGIGNPNITFRKLFENISTNNLLVNNRKKEMKTNR